MCGIGSGLDAFGRGNSTPSASQDDCKNFYLRRTHPDSRVCNRADANSGLEATAEIAAGNFSQ
jgi:hypothetical protein